MKLAPRYAPPPPIVFLGERSNVLVPLVRQRTRLDAMARELTADEWQTPSRCEGWSVQDVIAHLTGVNDFWTFSINAGLAGEPTRVLAEFDPVAVPASLVDAARASSTTEIAQRF